MKIALYIEDGLEQIVLTPQTDTEKGIVGKLCDGGRGLSIRRGGFYQCLGGWLKEASNQDSTIIVLRKAPPPPPPPVEIDEVEQTLPMGFTRRHLRVIYGALRDAVRTPRLPDCPDHVLTASIGFELDRLGPEREVPDAG